MSSRSAKIWLNVILTISILSYGVYSLVVLVDRRSERSLVSINVEVRDSAEVGFITSAQIRALLQDSVARLGVSLSEVELQLVEELLDSNQYIAHSEAYTTMEGGLEISVAQRRAALRVITEGGYDFYVDTTLYVMQTNGNYRPKVQIISGDMEFSFPRDFSGRLTSKNSPKEVANIKKLFNFVRNIENDDFLKDFVSQVYVRQESNGTLSVEVVPSRGEFIVLLGGLEGMDEKLDRVKLFYRSAYRYAGLDTLSAIDFRYSGQIVVR